MQVNWHADTVTSASSTEGSQRLPKRPCVHLWKVLKRRFVVLSTDNGSLPARSVDVFNACDM